MTKLAATMMTHNAYSHGRDNLIDADLNQLAEAYPDLRPVFEELQFLRHENEQQERDLEIARDERDMWRQKAHED